MSLRSRSHDNRNKGEKRQSDAAGGDAEPKSKRVALSDISNTFSNVLLDSTKKPIDKKPFDQEACSSCVKPISDPCPEFDFDKECGNDIVQVTDYANDIVKYYQHRQIQFPIKDYLKNQRYINSDMRAALINWLVYAHEQFEMNHETLYLAVKLIDIFLSRTSDEVCRGDLKLLGGTALLLAAKFDERVPPTIDDILYMCDKNNYDADKIRKMERLLFQTIGFDLGIPISYRFLRRFSRVVKSGMQTLTLARYILETSLMFYQFVGIKDDLMASASLLLALRMKNRGNWNAQLVKYTGYTLEEVEPLMKSLNHMIIKRRADYDRWNVIFNKYSHVMFYEVTKTPSLEDEFKLDDPIGPPSTLSFH